MTSELEASEANIAISALSYFYLARGIFPIQCFQLVTNKELAVWPCERILYREDCRIISAKMKIEQLITKSSYRIFFRQQQDVRLQSLLHDLTTTIIPLMQDGKIQRLQACIFDSVLLSGASWPSGALLEVLNMDIVHDHGEAVEIWIRWEGINHDGPVRHRAAEPWTNVGNFMSNLTPISHSYKACLYRYGSDSARRSQLISADKKESDLNNAVTILRSRQGHHKVRVTRVACNLPTVAVTCATVPCEETTLGNIGDDDEGHEDRQPTRRVQPPRKPRIYALLRSEQQQAGAANARQEREEYPMVKPGAVSTSEDLQPTQRMEDQPSQVRRHYDILMGIPPVSSSPQRPQVSGEPLIHEQLPSTLIMDVSSDEEEKSEAERSGVARAYHTRTRVMEDCISFPDLNATEIQTSQDRRIMKNVMMFSDSDRVSEFNTPAGNSNANNS